MENIYRLYRNQDAAAYSTLYFFIFLSVQFSKPNYKKFSLFFSELWGLEGWNLVHTWTVGRCIVYLNQAAAAYSFLYFFIFLSNFQTLKFFVTLFSGSVRPRRLKLGTHVDSGQMYQLCRNQAAATYSSRYFFIFLSLQFSNIKIFRHTFLRNCEALKVITWNTRGQMYHVYWNQDAAAYSTLYFFIFLSVQFSKPNYKKNSLFFSELLRPRRLKLGTHMDSGQMYCVYPNQAAAAYPSLCFFIILSLQFWK